MGKDRLSLAAGILCYLAFPVMAAGSPDTLPGTAVLLSTIGETVLFVYLSQMVYRAGCATMIALPFILLCITCLGSYGVGLLAILLISSDSGLLVFGPIIFLAITLPLKTAVFQRHLWRLGHPEHERKTLSFSGALGFAVPVQIASLFLGLGLALLLENSAFFPPSRPSLFPDLEQRLKQGATGGPSSGTDENRGMRLEPVTYEFNPYSFQRRSRKSGNIVLPPDEDSRTRQVIDEQLPGFWREAPDSWIALGGISAEGWPWDGPRDCMTILRLPEALASATDESARGRYREALRSWYSLLDEKESLTSTDVAERVRRLLASYPELAR